jgi:uncharacterized protein (DUF362 family)
VLLPRAAGRLDSLYLPKTALGCDLLVSLPKMKTHHWAGIAESIVAINSVFPGRFTIVDGIEGMEGKGPIQGCPKLAGVIVGGPDRVAVDATCCRIMGFDPRKVRHLKLAETLGQTGALNVRQIGESILAVATPFGLLPSLRGPRLTSQ